ncbi:MAG: hypothetical protein CM1200mP26_00490 [Acidimicrobiales bacterium]|nr:MAG: hypothetical protein CM1200mP26_00490 [Acidimicrobiales bacterium]
MGGDGAVLWLTDVRGRRVGVPPERIATWTSAPTGGPIPSASAERCRVQDEVTFGGRRADGDTP